MLFTKPQSPTQISEQLYIGNLPVGSDKEQLKNLGITHIIIAASLLEPLYPEVISPSIRISHTSLLMLMTYLALI